MKRFPYTYDLIIPSPPSKSEAFVELIDIPIPQETVSIEAYLHLKTEELDRVRHFAGSAVWLGLNRPMRECARCKITLTNIKIDIAEYLSTNSITKKNIDQYLLVIEGAGRLIEIDTENYRRYTQEELLGGGEFKLVIV